MNLVVDTSALIAVILNEPSKAKIITLTENATLIAPLPLHWEMGNAFSVMLKRKRYTYDEITKAILSYHQIPIRFVGVDLGEAIEVANRLGIYAYDAYILQCSIEQNIPILTLDGGLIYAAKRAKVQVLEVAP